MSLGRSPLELALDLKLIPYSYRGEPQEGEEDGRCGLRECALLCETAPPEAGGREAGRLGTMEVLISPMESDEKG